MARQLIRCQRMTESGAQLEFSMLVQNWDIHYFNEVESTNLIVKEHIRAGYSSLKPKTYNLKPSIGDGPSGFVAVAKKQSCGKGMRGHSWCSPEGGLYFSLLLQPSLAPDKLPEIPLRIATVVMNALQPLSSEPLTIKPPNDIVLDQLGNRKVEKLVGISTELYMEKLCVGIGINVFHPEEEFQVEGLNQPVYLEDFSTQELTLNFVLKTVLDALNVKLEI